jgi:hypothetical protein
VRQLLAIAVLTGMMLSGDASPQAATSADVSRPTPVVIELYTSEGCSDCPPADRVLSELVAKQPVPGVQVIALGEHVDYWNYLGWRDRFSSAAITQRQKDYQASVFSPTPVYTPQLVIDGHLQCVGSDASAVRRSIQRAAEATKARVHLTASEPSAGQTSATIDVEVPRTMNLDGPADILVAVLEDGLVTRVERGENGGRTLGHDAVVRRLATVGRMAPRERSASLTAQVALAEDWQAERLSIVAFVQEAESLRIVGAASMQLPN